ncbi:MAG: hypothetical protein EA376_03905 [Phycisphaeraceae bacterium]|nr:MAG: hypothetical protein EA376_03905 [Phycisphaeraceae bacterium]
MTWRITDAGFAMTLTRDVPPAIRDHIGEFLAQEDAGAGSMRSCIVHPGGPGVLDAVESALVLPSCAALDAARDTLRRHGNMSSATILFVLDEALRRGCESPHTLLAFGPGLSMERLTIL